MAVDIKKPGHKPAGKTIPTSRIKACERVTRNLDQEIRRRNEQMTVGALRKIYGRQFAAGYSRNASLAAVLDAAGVRSLSEYLKKARP
jgi:hypothetical protein